MVDLDSHLMIFPHKLREMFGPGLIPNNGRPRRQPDPAARKRFLAAIRSTAGIVPNPENVFTLKGFPYGSNVASERLDVINAMGSRAPAHLPERPVGCAVREHARGVRHRAPL